MITRAQWGSAHDSYYRAQTRIGSVSRLVIHHTASSQPSSAAASAGFVRQMENYGGDGRWIEYHAVIDQFGQVFEGYDARSQGAHCNQKPPGESKSFNSTSLGLCFIGYFYPPYDHAPTGAALDAAARWVADRVLAGDLYGDVLEHGVDPHADGWRGHKETGAATACPGNLLDSGALASMMNHAAQLAAGTDDDMTPEQAAQLTQIHQALYGLVEGFTDPAGNTVSANWAALWSNQQLIDSVMPRLASIEAILAELAGT